MRRSNLRVGTDYAVAGPAEWTRGEAQRVTLVDDGTGFLDPDRYAAPRGELTTLKLPGGGSASGRVIPREGVYANVSPGSVLATTGRTLFFVPLSFIHSTWEERDSLKPSTEAERADRAREEKRRDDLLAHEIRESVRGAVTAGVTVTAARGAVTAGVTVTAARVRLTVPRDEGHALLALLREAVR